MARKLGGRFSETIIYLSAEDAELRAGLDRAANRFRKFRAETENDARALQSSVRSAFDFGGLLKLTGAGAAIGGGLLAGVGLTSLVTDSIKLAANIESVAASFETMIGDAKIAKDLFAEIKALAAATPLETKDLAEVARQLLGVGVVADQIVPTLEVLGNIAGVDAEKLKGLALVYGQVMSKGVLFGDDFKQFNERVGGFGLALAKTMRVGKDEIAGLIEEGRVGFPQVQQALHSLANDGGRFAGNLEKQSKTFNGMLSTLRDNWDTFLAGFGDALIEEWNLKGLVSGISDALGGGKAGIDSLRPALREVRELAVDAGRNLVDGFEKASTKVGELINQIDRLGGKLSMDGTWLQGFAKFGERMQDVAEDRTFAIRDKIGGTVLDGLIGGGETSLIFAGIAGAMFGTRDAEPDNGGPVDVQQIRGWAQKARDILERFGSDAGADIGNTMGEAMGKGFASRLKDFSIQAEGLFKDQRKKAKELFDQLDPGAGVARQVADLGRLRDMGGLFQRHLLGGNAFAKMREQAAFEFGVGDAIRRGLGIDADAALAGFNRDVGVARQGSAEAAIVGINAHNSGLVSKENAALEAARQQVQKLEMLIQQNKAIFELWQARKLPGMF